MPNAINTTSSTWLSTDQEAKTASYRFRRYASTTDAIDVYHSFRYNTFTPPTTLYDTQYFLGPGTEYKNKTVDLTCDTTYYWRASASFGATTVLGIIKSFKAYAVDPDISPPDLSEATSSSIDVDGLWLPATVESTCYCYVQYKKTSDSTWTTFGTYVDSASGNDHLYIDTTTVTGLDAETSYDFRLWVSRPTTSNTTKNYYSDYPSTLSTIADTPDVTTDAASSVNNSSATLNATVDHNTVDGNLKWRYLKTADYSAPPDEAQGTEVTYASNPITADGSGSYGISSLDASTGYTFWAIYDPTGAEDTVLGDAATFTTTVNPLEDAGDEDLMITQYVDGQYGVATTVYFTLRQPAATSSDLYYTSTAPLQADVKISKDGVYDSTSDNAPAQIASITQLYSLVVSAAEMQANVVDIIISDAVGSAFRDHHIQIRTQLNLGTIVVNAAQKATNTTAATFTGNGTGAGISFVGGDNDGKDIDGVLNDFTLNAGTLSAYDSTTVFDLDVSTAVDVADYYNGAIILFTGGTGVGQARTITDYVAGGAYRVTVNKALTAAASTDTTYVILPGPDSWDVSPGTELTALPTAASSFAEMVQFLFQRFAYQREQTATAFTMRKVDGATSFASGGVDDDGTTQTHNALT